ncbi:potassium channel family protein [Pontibacter sp. G13]|uniref:potassium channel family protein n=1 Tax=Pontibacter sp. G13 TaxID=3074898 RepID=UPI00288A673D|nr:potassium channel family protein [Pontibacter sp. G13]WNJ18973.1 potassium channel family protein [Pontibacter sp. G13]
MKQFLEWLASKNNFSLLFFFLSMGLVVPPMVEQTALHSPAFQLCFSLAILSGVVAMRKEGEFINFGLTVSVVCLSLVWLDYMIGGAVLKIISLGLYIVYFCILFYKTTHLILSKDQISNQLLIAGIAGYMLLGYISAFALMLVQISYPQSFGISDDKFLQDLIYFAFVTLSTVGYGDITPETSVAKSVSVLIGVAGQMYLTLLVALLVGKYLQNPTLPSSDEKSD